MKPLKPLFGLLLDASRLVLLFFWFQLFPGEWNRGSEANLFFLFLIGPQIVFPLGWGMALFSPVPEVYRSLGISVRWTMVTVEISAALWLFFTMSLVPWDSFWQPEFQLTLLIGILDIIILVLLKGLPSDGISDARE